MLSIESRSTVLNCIGGNSQTEMESSEPLSKRSRGNDNGYGFAPAHDITSAPPMYGMTPDNYGLPTENRDQECRRYNTPEGCQYGSTCRFKHGPTDNRELNQSVLASGGKSKPCTKFFSTAGCQYGDGCHFLHYVPVGINAPGFLPPNALGSVDMAIPARKQSVATADPSLTVNGFKTKLCNRYGTPEGCRFGDKCHFAHGEADLRPSNARRPSNQAMTTAPVMQTTNGMYNPTPAVYNNDTSATYISSTKFTNAANYSNPLPDTIYYGEPTPPGVSAATPSAPNSHVPASNSSSSMIGTGATISTGPVTANNLQYYSQ